MAKSARLLRLPEGAKRLRCTVGTSDKFYDILLEGDTYTVNYGRWGSSGAHQTKEFDSPRLARDAYNKQIRSKITKGYRDVTNVGGQRAETQQVRNAATDTMLHALGKTTPKSVSGRSSKAAKKTPESQGRKRRRLID